MITLDICWFYHMGKVLWECAPDGVVLVPDQSILTGSSPFLSVCDSVKPTSVKCVLKMLTVKGLVKV